MHSEAAGVDPAPAVGGSGMLARHRAGQDRRMRAALSIVLHLEAVGDVNLDVADVCILVKLGALPRQQRPATTTLCCLHHTGASISSSSPTHCPALLPHTACHLVSLLCHRQQHPGAHVEVGAQLDLASLESVRQFAAADKRQHPRPPDVLVNNAGVAAALWGGGRQWGGHLAGARCLHRAWAVVC